MDTFRLDRFVEAQQSTYSLALAELKKGKKNLHWMWFVFPQLKGLGKTYTSEFFGISGAAEARAYIEHPVLGPRLICAVQTICRHRDKTATQILGHTDTKKFRSCLTLFRAVAPENTAFDEGLRIFFDGKPDYHTLRLLEQQGNGGTDEH